jgi:hypothetical protein
MNNSGNGGESFGRWSARLYNLLQETSTVEASVDGTYGKGGGGGWHMGASTVDGCDGKGGGGGWPMGATTVDGWDMKYGGGEW